MREPMKPAAPVTSISLLDAKAMLNFIEEFDGRWRVQAMRMKDFGCRPDSILLQLTPHPRPCIVDGVGQKQCIELRVLDVLLPRSVHHNLIAEFGARSYQMSRRLKEFCCPILNEAKSGF